MQSTADPSSLLQPAAQSSLEMLYPLVAMVLLTLIVGVRMYLVRVAEMKRSRVHPEQLKTRSDAQARLSDTRASDHYANLFELPVVFYVAVFTIWLIGLSDGLYLVLAWAFFASRVVHATIHLTINRVMWRFAAFITGFGLLTVIWLRIAFQLLLA